jgi:trehalose 6-phosphate synthase/phosphatase
MDAASLVIASNRLPVSVSVDDNEILLEPSSGGLVSALRGMREEHDWVGWPGTVVPEHLQVLVLSELAGAANVLPGALLVNPWDAADIHARLVEALQLEPAERRRRLELMADRVEQLDCRRWATNYLAQLDRHARRPLPRTPRRLDSTARERIRARFARATERTLLLDYDGTLRELTAHPDLATPTGEITSLLDELAALPDRCVHLVSGRTRETLAAWFGELPISLCAEDGYLARPAGGDWRKQLDADLSWLPEVEGLLNAVAADVPGTLVERKTASVAWHYRQAEPEYGSWRARELLVALEETIAGKPAEILPGHWVIEVRARGVNNGTYVHRLFPVGTGSDHLVLAAGDDLTDVDLYRALPAGAVALHVGRVRPSAHDLELDDQYSLDSPPRLRELLRTLARSVAARSERSRRVSR